MSVGRTEIDESLLPLCKELAERRLQRELTPEEIIRERNTIAEIDRRLEETSRRTRNMER